ncbi:MAG: leader peptidase (prepilin peptidase)/N-methyltransferase [Patiriisocius sp.]|jgi:leader peptidase (prepilin peptidase)/N-methyltransferase
MLGILSLVPTWYQYFWVLMFGLIIGSFLNVVIYRYHTGRSLSGHSHCLSCGEKLHWYELFPLVSYMCLFGRCRTCGCKIPARYFLVELTTSLLFLLMWTQFGSSLLLLVSLALVVVLMVITVYDMYHMVIPNQLVLMTSVIATVYYFIQYFDTWSLLSLSVHFLGALSGFLFYGGLWLVSKGKWIGLGDAKLALPLGFILGVPAVFTFIVFSFWIGAVISVGILALPYVKHLIRRTYTKQLIVNSPRYFTIKSEVPFAPFIVAAFLVVYVFNLDVIALMSWFV